MDVKDEIAAEVDKLPVDLQEQVLRFVVTLVQSAPKGESGSELRRFAGCLDPVSAEEMKQAIEEGCERVDTGEW